MSPLFWLVCVLGVVLAGILVGVYFLFFKDDSWLYPNQIADPDPDTELYPDQ